MLVQFRNAKKINRNLQRKHMLERVERRNIPCESATAVERVTTMRTPTPMMMPMEMTTRMKMMMMMMMAVPVPRRRQQRGGR